jgi:hypothetical protein
MRPTPPKACSAGRRLCCQKNLNNIDLLIILGYDFRSAVVILERLLNQYQARMARKTTPPASNT